MLVVQLPGSRLLPAGIIVMVVNRRWFGVLVLVGVLFVAVLGTDPLTRRVAGDPAVVTVPGSTGDR